jgi:hypothetical protein
MTYLQTLSGRSLNIIIQVIYFRKRINKINMYNVASIAVAV